jgi:hypothetical protein
MLMQTYKLHPKQNSLWCKVGCTTHQFLACLIFYLTQKMPHCCVLLQNLVTIFLNVVEYSILNPNAAHGRDNIYWVQSSRGRKACPIIQVSARGSSRMQIIVQEMLNVKGLKFKYFSQFSP